MYPFMSCMQTSKMVSSNWPRFLVIGSSNEDPFQKLAPFAIQKGLVGLAGESKCNKTGNWINDGKTEKHSKCLCNLPTLTPHNILSSHTAQHSLHKTPSCHPALHNTDSTQHHPVTPLHNTHSTQHHPVTPHFTTLIRHNIILSPHTTQHSHLTQHPVSPHCTTLTPHNTTL